ncbi:MAG: hypothetical protein BMS9Abin28_0551 [Anaerolineae bacterium]|nr:MAG: hypothetical protein BMS9Abin28_0551 [Anaerolineae bacterium]
MIRYMVAGMCAGPVELQSNRRYDLRHNARKIRQLGQNRVAWRMYRYSSLYPAGIMLALMADALIVG